MSEQLMLPAFEHEIVTLDISKIQATKEILPSVLASTKFAVIFSSIKEVGIIEPPVVSYRVGKYLLLDGHLRIQALKKLNIEQVDCLLSTDDESFTYNKHVNRLSNVQEHRMIAKAIERGVSPERLAKVLNLDVSAIINKKNLLDGICKEAEELLKDKIVSSGVFTYLKRMKETRQLEAVKLMIDMNNYGTKFARSIWQASSDAQLKNPTKRKNVVDLAKLGRLENEVSNLQEQYRFVEDNYGIQVLNLTLVKNYVKTLYQNDHVKNYLKANAPDIYQVFQNVIELENLNL